MLSLHAMFAMPTKDDPLSRLSQINIVATFNSAVITTGITLEDDTEKRYAKLAKEARAWNKYFAILRHRYS